MLFSDRFVCNNDHAIPYFQGVGHMVNNEIGTKALEVMDCDIHRSVDYIMKNSKSIAAQLAADRVGCVQLPFLRSLEPYALLMFAAGQVRQEPD